MKTKINKETESHFSDNTKTVLSNVNDVVSETRDMLESMKKMNSYFFKVSKKQFEEDMANLHPELSLDTIEVMQSLIELPERATVGSAGYDFYSPMDFELRAGESIVVPTGIGWDDLKLNTFLALFPRSGMGFKMHVQLANTVGIIDSDYANSDNEGHIMIKIYYDGAFSKKKGNIFKKLFGKRDTLVVKAGDKFAQGIIIPFMTVIDDDTKEKRNGGFQSTGK